jgi:hypothetical protein
MNSLKLTQFKKDDGGVYLDYEKSCKPEDGNMYFIYGLEAKGIESSEDKGNIVTIKRVFGYSKKDKFDNMAVSQVKTNKNDGAMFITSRTNELSLMYDELARLFLKYLHKSVWSCYDTTKKKYVLSTIDFQDAYEDLKLGIESFEIILTKIINDKYDEKYAEVETKNAIR